MSNHNPEALSPEEIRSRNIKGGIILTVIGIFTVVMVLYAAITAFRHP